MNPLLANSLNQTVTIAHQTGASASGLPTYGTATSASARLTPKDVWSINKDGASVVNHAEMVLLAGTVTISSTDQITLPSGEKRPVLEIKSSYNQRGLLDHYEVMV